MLLTSRMKSGSIKLHKTMRRNLISFLFSWTNSDGLCLQGSRINHRTLAATLILCGEIKPAHKEPDMPPNKTRLRPKGHIHTFAHAQIPSLSFIQA